MPGPDLFAWQEYEREALERAALAEWNELLVRVLGPPAVVPATQRRTLADVEAETRRIAPGVAPFSSAVRYAPDRPSLDGPSCRVCGSIMRRIGPCWTCAECGDSGGCG